MLLRATLVQYSLRRFHIILPDSFRTILEFLDMANTHPDQLTLAEFSALRTRRLVQNLDMIAISRTVQLSEKNKAANAEDNDGNANEPRKGTTCM